MDRITGTEIELELVDVTASEDATYQTTQKQPWNNAEEQIKEGGTSKDYSTLEKNDFVLDGNAILFPENIDGDFFGWWSRDYSKNDCTFKEPPILTINFSEKHSSVGITLIFPDVINEWAGALNIKWYNQAGNVIQTKDFYPNSSTYFCEGSVIDYKKIVITFYSTALPYRYLKLSSIMFGMVKQFTGKELVTAEIYEEIDPTSATLPINTLEFGFKDSEGLFSPLRLEGTYAFFQQRQQLKVKGIINSEKHNLGTYYYEEFESPDIGGSMVNIRCIDTIGVIEQTEYKGGLYNGISAGELIGDILSNAGLKPSEWNIDPRLITKTLTGWIPICTHREALRQVVFAIGGVVDCTRSNTINIYPLPTEQTAIYDTSRKVEGHNVKYSMLVTGCEVSAHQYLPIYKFTEDETEIVNDILSVGRHEIKFREPMHDLKITTGSATIIESGANYAILDVTTEEAIVLKGEEYNDVVTLTGYYNEDLPAHQKPNVISISDNMTLISKDNALEVAQRIYTHYQNRYTDEGKVILNPNTDKIGTIASIQSSAGNIRGLVIGINIDISGGVIGNVKAIGDIEQIEQSNTGGSGASFEQTL